MNSVGNFKSVQLRKLFRIFRSRIMKRLSIFRATEGIHFEFTILSCFLKFGKISNQADPPVSPCFQTPALCSSLLCTTTVTITGHRPDQPFFIELCHHPTVVFDPLVSADDPVRPQAASSPIVHCRRAPQRC
jgi:hypothetical protein